MTTYPLSQVQHAFKVVLQETANWRSEALGNPAEWARRDRLLLATELLGADIIGPLGDGPRFVDGQEETAD